ncbi:AMP-binding protein [Psychrobacter sp. FDAARGOS_221]|uniref:AMP-binding protein n=1 Tax=Psychrobacter sp. FDAARGOS_221 TaxID=1975705 RepID=UPI000BB588D0|nr:AMP-binding protein [Psychrobacter sp. FDAARGOS_221]PNK60177.1 AMP-binding protein [Psychrobacter sp. FDAARGOS_221]
MSIELLEQRFPNAASRNAPLTLSHDIGPTESPLIEDTIGDYFDQVANRYPNKEALVSRHQNIRLSYQQLQQQANQLASSMINMGLEKGDRVGIWSHNNTEWLLMQLATAKAGLILVNINPAYRISELQYALNKVDCKVLVFMRHFKTSDYVQMIQQMAPEICHQGYQCLELTGLPNLKRVIWIDAPDSDEHFGFMQRFSDWLAEGDANDPRVAERGKQLDANDPINIQFTSGTTGTPKGATLTHRNLLNNAYHLGETLGLTPEDKLCLPLPLYHCFAMVLGNLTFLMHAATLVYPSTSFDPLTVLQAIDAEKCTALHAVPSMFLAILNHPDFDQYDVSSLRTGVSGGSSCPRELMQRIINDMHMRDLTIAYGMTETSPKSTQTLPTTSFEKCISTVGLVQPHLEVKIVDTETRETLPIGEVGEVLTKGYAVMAGYWNDSVKTTEAVVDGWMHTGDLGSMDEEGYITIVGRSKDMVIRGGENIYPIEVENFLYKHPKIADVQIVGVPDKRYGEVLAAWIIPKQGQTITEQEIRDFCYNQIAHFKIPTYIRFVEQYPMTVTGKIQKFKIVDAMKEELSTVA